MRDAFSRTLVSIAQRDPNVLLLTGDHGYALFDEFRRACPRQYLNVGVAEQNMVGMAAGLSRVGFRPFVYGLSAFVPVRVVEQIKLDVAHDHLPVVFLGDGAGFVYSHLGTSHQSTEDIACTRAIPGLTILSPADRHEMTACMECAYASRSPVYLRMGKADRGDVHVAPLPKLESRKLLPLGAPGRSALALVATGSMVRTALDMANRGLDVSIWSAPCVKPLDVEQICEIGRSCAGIVVMEEHSVLGGLGAAIAEIVSEHLPRPVLRIGVNDRFSRYCGSYEYLLREHELDADAVWSRIRAFAAKDWSR